SRTRRKDSRETFGPDASEYLSSSRHRYSLGHGCCRARYAEVGWPGKHQRRDSTRRKEQAVREEGDKFGRWIGMSLALHLGLFSIAVIWPSLLTLRGESHWGSSTASSDGIQVRVAAGIPGIALPSPPVVREDAAANESKGLHTSEPAPKPEEKVKPEEKKVD